MESVKALVSSFMQTTDFKETGRMEMYEMLSSY